MSATPGSPSPRKLLVLSDLHLGRDHEPIAGFDDTHRPSPEFDENFVALLEHYTAAAPERWRVLINGDFVDFVEVVVRPELDTELSLVFEVTREEQALGLNTEPERAKVKLDMIVDYHERFFAALACFVRAGGELVMIRGNHDAEMFWGKVQRALRHRLARLGFAGEKLEFDELLAARADFQSRIQFVPWCYVEPGRIYLEHGHQYDPYCSFDHQLYPVSPFSPRRIDTPIFMFAMRYFVNRLADFATYYKDFWTTKDYLRWLTGKGPRGLTTTLLMGAEASGRMVHYAVFFWLGRAVGYGDEHERRLREEAERFDVEVDALTEVDALHATPVNRNLPELLRLLFLDKIFLGTGLIFLLLLGLVLIESPIIELVWVLLTGALGWSLYRRLTPRQYALPGPRQVDAAREIVERLDVATVVMGHSHQRRSTDLGEGRRYFNTGCWLPPIHPDGHPPDDTCTCNLSHLVVEDNEPELRIFCWVNKRPRSAVRGELSPPKALPNGLVAESVEGLTS